jgi:hypothetical protein
LYLQKSSEGKEQKKTYTNNLLFLAGLKRLVKFSEKTFDEI